MDDDEEEAILQANPTLVPFFEVQVEKIKERYIHLLSQRLMVPETETTKDLLAEAEARKEEFRLRASKQPRRVPEDVMIDVNIGLPEQPKFVKISKTLDEDTMTQITALLKEYSDVFAWSYKDMKGIDPTFYEHHIDPRTDAVPMW